jgi:tetratricopeptide (TPR) repeat protein
MCFTLKSEMIRKYFKKAAFMLLSFIIVMECHATGNIARQDSLFNLGNKYYHDNQFALAVKTYEQMIAMPYESPELYFNLGNAYFKNGNLAYAILFYEKAKLLAPRDEDINQNLAIANARVVDKIDVIPVFFIKRWIQGWVNMLPSNTWALISLVLFSLALVLLLLYFFSGVSFIKRISFYASLGFILLTLVTYISSARRKKYIVGNNAAIIAEPSVTIKSSPDTGGNNLFVLHDGTKVIITDSIQNWKEIRISNGNKGWMESKSLLPI